MADRDFKGIWIPKNVWLDTRLSALDKVILAEIDSLDQGDRGCFASNKHIADFCQCSEWKVSTSISKLVDCGYLKIKSFDGRQREIKSRLVISQKQPCEKPKADLGKSKHSNTDNKPANNTVNRKNIKKEFIPPTLEEIQQYCKERKNNVDSKKFFDYYEADNWIDSKGNPVRNWKQKVITWEGRNGGKTDEGSNGDTGKIKYGNYI